MLQRCWLTWGTDKIQLARVGVCSCTQYPFDDFSCSNRMLYYNYFSECISLKAHIQVGKSGASEGEEGTPEACFSYPTLQNMDFSEAEPGCSYCLPFVQNEPSVSSLNADIEYSDVYTVPTPDSGRDDPRLGQLVTGALHYKQLVTGALH